MAVVKGIKYGGSTDESSPDRQTGRLECRVKDHVYVMFVQKV